MPNMNPSIFECAFYLMNLDVNRIYRNGDALERLIRKAFLDNVIRCVEKGRAHFVDTSFWNRTLLLVFNFIDQIHHVQG